MKKLLTQCLCLFSFLLVAGSDNEEETGGSNCLYQGKMHLTETKVNPNIKQPIGYEFGPKFESGFSIERFLDVIPLNNEMYMTLGTMQNTLTQFEIVSKTSKEKYLKRLNELYEELGRQIHALNAE